MKINYELKISKRARGVRIAVHCDGKVVVTAPWFFGKKRARDFVSKKENWILEKLQKFSKFEKFNLPKISKKELLHYKKQAEMLVKEKIKHFNSSYNFKYNKITIKKIKTRWGSCSKKRNLNFNFKIIFLPKELADYLVVHELCHLGQMNHSKNFWNLVSQTIPNYKVLNKRLKTVILH